jgi:hypothetical protein
VKGIRLEKNLKFETEPILTLIISSYLLSRDSRPSVVLI